MHDDELIRMEQKAYSETMKDGVTETLAGMFFLFTTLIIQNPVFVGVFVGIYILFLPQFLERVRERYTYPRLGYVRLRTSESDLDTKSFWLLLLLTLVSTAIGVQVLTNDILNISNWALFLPFVMGMLMLGASSYLVTKTGSKAYWSFGFITTSFGLAVSLLSVLYAPVHYTLSIQIYCLLLGVIFGIGGLIKFIHFTRTNPILKTPEDEANEQV